jgi:hypothetical protein
MHGNREEERICNLENIVISAFNIASLENKYRKTCTNDVGTKFLGIRVNIGTFFHLGLISSFFRRGNNGKIDCVRTYLRLSASPTYDRHHTYRYLREQQRAMPGIFFNHETLVLASPLLAMCSTYVSTV